MAVAIGDGMTTSNLETLTLSSATLAGRTRLLVASYAPPPVHLASPDAARAWARAQFAVAAATAPGATQPARNDCAIMLAGYAAGQSPAIRHAIVATIRACV